MSQKEMKTVEPPCPNCAILAEAYRLELEKSKRLKDLVGRITNLLVDNENPGKLNAHRG